MSTKAPARSLGTASGAGLQVDAAWAELAQLTPARVALGRSGVSLPTTAALAFGVAHARARDAVHAPLDAAALREALEREGWVAIEPVQSCAPDRAAYLARPDWGRRLDPACRQRLAEAPPRAVDLLCVLADGLSPMALQVHAVPLLRALRARLSGLRWAPLVVATQARVALADDIAETWGARFAISLIGERPGLSAPDSLGLYLTAAPRVGVTDAERDCISNIHGAGLGYDEAAAQCAALVESGLRLGLSGVPLARALGRAGQ